MTQSELAKELGVSKSYVSMLMSGQRKPSKRVAEKLKQVNLTVNNECGTDLKSIGLTVEPLALAVASIRPSHKLDS